MPTIFQLVLIGLWSLLLTAVPALGGQLEGDVPASGESGSFRSVSITTGANDACIQSVGFSVEGATASKFSGNNGKFSCLTVSDPVFAPEALTGFSNSDHYDCYRQILRRWMLRARGLTGPPVV